MSPAETADVAVVRPLPLTVILRNVSVCGEAFTVASVIGIVALPDPSNEADVPVASVDSENVLPIASTVAVDALPVRAPTNDDDVTEVNPTSVVDVAPSAMFVEPIVTELFVSALLGIFDRAPLGIFVSPEPEPVKVVAFTVVNNADPSILMPPTVVPDLATSNAYNAVFLVTVLTRKLDEFALLSSDDKTCPPEVPIVMPPAEIFNVPVIVSPAFRTFNDAAPVNAPVNAVDVTDVSPASVVDVAPSAMFVEPIVSELFVRAPFGIPVKFVPVSVGVFDQLGAVGLPINTCEVVPEDKNDVTPVAD